MIKHANTSHAGFQESRSSVHTVAAWRARSVALMVVALVLCGVLFIWPDQALAGQHRAMPAQEAPAAASASPAVLVDATAVITDGVIAYTIQAVNLTSQSVWDLNITLPIPEDTLFLSAEVTPPLVAEHHDRSVTFYASELKGKASTGPQRVRVALAKGALADQPTGLVTTRVEASWKVVGAVMHQSTWFSASAATSTLILPPDTDQQLVADIQGDVPLPNYDLTGVSVRQEGSIIRTDFYVAGPVGPVGEPSRFTIYFDADCNGATGSAEDKLGIEYRVIYRHDRGRAEIDIWTVAPGTEGQWLAGGSIGVSNPAGGQTITMWIPSVVLGNSEHFCWFALSEQRTAPDAPKLAKDRVPSSDKVEGSFTQFARWDEVAEIALSKLITDTAPPVAAGSTDVQPAGLLLSIAPPSVNELSGKLAVALGNDQGSQAVHVFSLPDGRQLLQIPDAHQPELRNDGALLLFSRGAGGESTVYQFDLESETETPLLSGTSVSYPSYNPLGTLVAYEDYATGAKQAVAISTTEGSSLPAITLGCGLPPAAQELVRGCGGFSGPNVLVSAEPFGEIRGTHPLWTATNKIVYRGCHSWGGVDGCGIFSLPVSSSSGQRFYPERLTFNGGDLPGDTTGNLAVIMSQQNSDWEVLALSLDGGWVINLSRDPSAIDGLPAVSPDGTWVAFVSNRGGEWAIWGAPITGASVQKLVDLPAGVSWDVNGDEWKHARMSWGR